MVEYGLLRGILGVKTIAHIELPKAGASWEFWAEVS